MFPPKILAEKIAPNIKWIVLHGNLRGNDKLQAKRVSRSNDNQESIVNMGNSKVHLMQYTKAKAVN